MTQPPPRIFDTALYGQRRQRAAAMSGNDLYLAKDAAEQLAFRAYTVNRTFRHALDLNSRPQIFPLLRPLAVEWTRTGAEETAHTLTDEALPFAPEQFDLVVSVLWLHAVNDLPGLLRQIRQVLKPDGLFLACLFGGNTLQELRHAFAAAEAEATGGASPRVAPFADVRDLGGLLQRAGFALPVADCERTIIQYRDLGRLFADLRALGETNTLIARSHRMLPRRVLAAAAQEYASRFSGKDGRLTATFDLIYLTGWSPHESQQKPLEPGSAKARLADALGTKEFRPQELAAPEYPKKTD